MTWLTFSNALVRWEAEWEKKLRSDRYEEKASLCFSLPEA
jgi:hypothetical protein